MKKILLLTAITGFSLALKAQELAPDQNARYKESQDKYTAQQAALQSTMNTTVQNTYKAYDFQTAKAERKAERREYNRQMSYLNNYYGYNNYRYNNGYYRRGYNYNSYRSPYRRHHRHW